MTKDTIIEREVEAFEANFFKSKNVYNDSAFGETLTSGFFCGCYEGDLSGRLDDALPSVKAFFREALTRIYEAGRKEREAELVTYFEALKEQATSFRDQVYLDGVIAVISPTPEERTTAKDALPLFKEIKDNWDRQAEERTSDLPPNQ